MNWITEHGVDVNATATEMGRVKVTVEMSRDTYEASFEDEVSLTGRMSLINGLLDFPGSYPPARGEERDVFFAQTGPKELPNGNVSLLLILHSPAQMLADEINFSWA